MRNMKRLALSALVLLIPALVWADEKETMLHALGQFQQAWRSKNAVPDQQQSVSNPRDLAGTASSTSSGSVFRHPGCERAPRAELAARGASVIKYSQVRTEA